MIPSMQPIQLTKKAITNAITIASLTETKTTTDILSGTYLGHDDTGYKFRTGNGGNVYASILSTSEPIKGETYILTRTPGTDMMTAKPKPRL
jgi:hypothetical protein